MPDSDETNPIQILSSAVDYSFGKLFRVSRSQLRYRRRDGSMSQPVDRISFDRPPSVGLLLYDPAQDLVFLVKQLRFPAYLALDEKDREDNSERAWLTEIGAGVMGEGRAAEEVARAEVREEAGFTLRGDLEPLGSILPSPGASSEVIHLFLALVDQREVGAGGGLVEEGEDTEVVKLPLNEALEMIRDGRLTDAKTVVALQRLALRQKDAAAG